MIYFNCDYTEGAHPLILKNLLDTNMEQTIGYGLDSHSLNAQKLIKSACDCENADVHLLVGGTQTNLTLISSALRSYQGVIATSAGHISVHETGAIEAQGHKVLSLPCKSDGKLLAEDVEKTILAHINDPAREHCVMPKMVYISNSTENGSIYKKSEIKALSEVCKKYGLYFYLDGARLGYALCANDNDLSLSDLPKYFDAFYIGGTKVGAMFGEALVIVNDNLKENFRYHIKQKGAMLAKGRILGIQFETLFTNNLYLEISKHAIEMSKLIANAVLDCGLKLFAKHETNQIFVIMPKTVYAKLDTKYVLEYWEPYDETHDVVRICTSWATLKENVNKLIADIKEYVNV